MQKLQIGLAVLLASMVIGAPALLSSHVYAATPKDSVCQGLDATGQANCSGSASSDSVSSLVQNVVGLLSMVGGVIAVIMLIIGGIKYVISGGDTNSLTSARNTIIYALVGLVIIALAQVIVRFVVGRVSG